MPDKQEPTTATESMQHPSICSEQSTKQQQQWTTTTKTKDITDNQQQHQTIDTQQPTGEKKT